MTYPATNTVASLQQIWLFGKKQINVLKKRERAYLANIFIMQQFAGPECSQVAINDIYGRKK